MAKLTLTFKGRLLAVYRLEGASWLVGCDPDCAIQIDSLAVAPRHAQIVQTEEGLILTALDREHPVFRNGRRVDRTALADGDLILVGKHSLSVALTDDDAPQLTVPNRALPARREEPAESRDPVPAYVQVQSGPAIGQVIPLTRAVTRLNRIGGDEVIITRRGERYLLTRIGEANRVDVGRQSLEGDAEVELTNEVSIEVDGTRCQFFCPAGRADDEANPAAQAVPTAPGRSADRHGEA